MYGVQYSTLSYEKRTVSGTWRTELYRRRHGRYCIVLVRRMYSTYVYSLTQALSMYLPFCPFYLSAAFRPPSIRTARLLNLRGQCFSPLRSLSFITITAVRSIRRASALGHDFYLFLDCAHASAFFHHYSELSTSLS